MCFPSFRDMFRAIAQAVQWGVAGQGRKERAPGHVEPQRLGFLFHRRLVRGEPEVCVTPVCFILSLLYFRLAHPSTPAVARGSFCARWPMTTLSSFTFRLKLIQNPAFPSPPASPAGPPGRRGAHRGRSAGPRRAGQRSRRLTASRASPGSGRVRRTSCSRGKKSDGSEVFRTR